jgi:hypothetical protein
LVSKNSTDFCSDDDSVSLRWHTTSRSELHHNRIAASRQLDHSIGDTFIWATAFCSKLKASNPVTVTNKTSQVADGHRATPSKPASALCERILPGRHAKMERQGRPATAGFGLQATVTAINSRLGVLRIYPLRDIQG